MKHKSRPWIAVAGLLLSLGAGTVRAAADADLPSEPFERNLPHILAALNSEGDADSLAAVALFSDHEAALNTLARAASLAPARPDLVWLQILTCAQLPACDPEPFAATLHRLDPDNGAAFAPLLDRATRRGDLVAETAYVKAIGATQRYDIYWNTIIARVSTAVLKVRAADAQIVLTAVIGRAAAFAIPAYKNVSMACKSPVVDALGRLDDCRHVASVMRNGDTYITEMIGIAIAKRVWPEDSVEYLDAVAARRLGRYRMATESTVSLTKLNTAEDGQRLLNLLREHRSEQQSTLALITAAGKEAFPPAQWKESEP